MLCVSEVRQLLGEQEGIDVLLQQLAVSFSVFDLCVFVSCWVGQVLVMRLFVFVFVGGVGWGGVGWGGVGWFW